MFSFLKHRKIGIEQLIEWEKADESFYAPGILVHIKTGKGMIKEVYGKHNGNSFMVLMMGDKPLVQFQGDEYYCPTCEKIIRAGYGLDSKEWSERIKANKKELAEIRLLNEEVEQIYPLLNLLREGYYVVLDTELYPTDGNGHFFWEPLDEVPTPGSCIYYGGDGEWGNLRPYFTMASQPPEKCDKNRVAYYMEHLEEKAVAYYLDGYMTILLDGHHKTFAAALRHEKVKALVIIPEGCTYQYDDGRKGLRFADIEFDIAQLGICEEQWKENRVTSERLNDIESRVIEKNFTEIKTGCPLPIAIDGLVNYYPTVHEQADIDRAGEIKEEMLKEILAHHKGYTGEEACILMNALVALKHPLVYKMGEFFSKQPYDASALYEIVEALTRLPKTEELENLLIERMVALEDDYPDIKKIILKSL